MPIQGSGIPMELFEGLLRAEERYPNVSFGMVLQAGWWRLLAARNGVAAERTLHECVVNNTHLQAVLDHEFEELAKVVAPTNSTG